MQTQLHLSQFLSELIARDRIAGETLFTALRACEPIFAENRLPFFPDFTDHGLAHIQRVLNGCEFLLTNPSKDMLTPWDGVALVVSVLLHDLAMHMSEDGFLALIAGQSTCKPVLYAGDVSWEQIWQEFLREARNWDARRLVAITGQPLPIEFPGTNHLEWDGRQRRFIGEFIRRHHPSIAHQIAVAGIPGPKSSESLIPLTDEVHKDVIGLIARSHGLQLRVAIDLLLSCHGSPGERVDRLIDGIHTTYIMILLRLGDYLDIAPERAGSHVSQTRNVVSPHSKLEHDMHRSVAEISDASDDPEAIFVRAKPKTALTYTRLRTLLTGLQSELDQTWAVLGETYGGHPKYTQFAVTLRRVRSNILIGDFGGPTSRSRGADHAWPFFPAEVAITTHSPLMLPLLVGPLYAQDPRFGVRELIQNAVDAVMQARHGLPKKSKLDRTESFCLNADVEVELKSTTSGTELVVSDRGIGMSAEIVRDYFLNAGASFRTSAAWLKDCTREDGTPAFIRSGRFGVGALAAFLVGSRINVTTRESGQPGISFSASLEDENIELRYVDCPIGTRISVPTSLELFDRSRFSGAKGAQGYSAFAVYLAEYPKVRIRFLGRNVDPKLVVPSANSPRAGWRRIRSSGFDAIDYTYSCQDLLVCNGIIVDDSGFSWPGGHFAKPSVSVWDRLGIFALNLTRTQLSDQTLPFINELYEDLACAAFQKLAARIDVLSWPSSILVPGELGYTDLGGSPWSTLWIGPSVSIAPLMSCNDRFGLVSKRSIESSGTNNVILIMTFGLTKYSATASKLWEILGAIRNTSILFAELPMSSAAIYELNAEQVDPELEDLSIGALGNFVSNWCLRDVRLPAEFFDEHLPEGAYTVDKYSGSFRLDIYVERDWFEFDNLTNVLASVSTWFPDGLMGVLVVGGKLYGAKSPSESESSQDAWLRMFGSSLVPIDRDARSKIMIVEPTIKI